MNFIGFFFQFTSSRYSKATEAVVMITKVISPIILVNLELVNWPMMLLLLQMCKMIPINTGAVNPYKIAE